MTGRSRPEGVLMRSWTRTLVWTIALVASATRAGAADGLSCGAIEGAGNVTGAGTIVLVGEMHGTEEIPAFVSDLGCSALERDLPVTVALEIPHEETDRVAAYLGSDGGAEARKALLAGSLWTSDVQYGVSSEGELGLIESLRRYRKAGRPVEVTLLDRYARDVADSRDAFMASRLAAAAEAAPRDVVIALTGNLHSRTHKGTPWDADYRPMGMELEERLPDRRIVAVDVAYTGGTAWNCRGDGPGICRAYDLGPTPMDGSGDRRIVLDASGELGEQGFAGYYTVGSLTASPPAVRPEPPAGAQPRR